MNAAASLGELPPETLESIRSKLVQLVESTDYLTATIANDPSIPAWPEVLSRYNILLSQTHSLSNTMTGANADSVDFTGPFANPNNALKQLSLHPSAASHPADQDNVLGVLLRTKQIPEIEKEEERLAELQTKEGEEDSLIDELVGQIRAHDKAVQEAHDHIAELRDQTEWAGRLEDTEVEEEQEQSTTSLEDLLRFVSSGSVGR